MKHMGDMWSLKIEFGGRRKAKTRHKTGTVTKTSGHARIGGIYL